jgi:hypothetical protein
VGHCRAKSEPCLTQTRSILVMFEGMPLSISTADFVHRMFACGRIRYKRFWKMKVLTMKLTPMLALAALA